MFCSRTAVECCVVAQILTGQIENLERIGNGNLLKAFYGKISSELPDFYNSFSVLVKENEMPIQRSLIQMELIGLAVNYNELRKTSDSIATLMQKLEQRIFQMHGKRFNISSSNEVAKVWFLFHTLLNIFEFYLSCSFYLNLSECFKSDSIKISSDSSDLSDSLEFYHFISISLIFISIYRISFPDFLEFHLNFNF